MAIANPYNYKKPAGVQAAVKKNVIRAIPQQKRSQQDVYLEQKVMSAKPEELTLMLYEGMIKFIKLSKLFIGENNPSKVHENAVRAQAIVDELRATLNMDYEVSNNLDSLYDFIGSRLTDGNMTKTEKPFDEALEIAEELHDTWKEAMTLI